MEEIPPSLKRYKDPVKRREQKRLAQARYRKTKKGKATDKRYWKGEAGHQAKQRSISRWRIRNPIKFQAHNKVNWAIVSGKLKKGVCEMCGSENTVAHHDDYSKPLDVRWLCRLHHNEVHCIPAYKRR